MSIRDEGLEWVACGICGKSIPNGCNSSGEHCYRCEHRCFNSLQEAFAGRVWYYKMADNGEEYLCAEKEDGGKEGDLATAAMRIDEGIELL